MAIARQSAPLTNAATASQWMAALRRLGRPSTAMRLIWLLAAGFHAWLIVRRVIAGEWTTAPDLIKAALCAGGVWYASLKFWRISTIFDACPRRAFAFFLMVALGHGFCHSPAAPDSPFAGSQFQVAAIAVLPAVGAALALALCLRRRQSVSRVARAVRRPVRLFARVVSLELPLFPDFSPQLFRKPPPAIA